MRSPPAGCEGGLRPFSSAASPTLCSAAWRTSPPRRSPTTLRLEAYGSEVGGNNSKRGAKRTSALWQRRGAERIRLDLQQAFASHTASSQFEADLPGAMFRAAQGGKDSTPARPAAAPRAAGPQAPSQVEREQLAAAQEAAGAFPLPREGQASAPLGKTARRAQQGIDTEGPAYARALEQCHEICWCCEEHDGIWEQCSFAHAVPHREHLCLECRVLLASLRPGGVDRASETPLSPTRADKAQRLGRQSAPELPPPEGLGFAGAQRNSGSTQGGQVYPQDTPAAQPRALACGWCLNLIEDFALSSQCTLCQAKLHDHCVRPHLREAHPCEPVSGGAAFPSQAQEAPGVLALEALNIQAQEVLELLAQDAAALGHVQEPSTEAGPGQQDEEPAGRDATTPPWAIDRGEEAAPACAGCRGRPGGLGNPWVVCGRCGQPNPNHCGRCCSMGSDTQGDLAAVSWVMGRVAWHAADGSTFRVRTGGTEPSSGVGSPGSSLDEAERLSGLGGEDASASPPQAIQVDLLECPVAVHRRSEELAGGSSSRPGAPPTAAEADAPAGVGPAQACECAT